MPSFAVVFDRIDSHLSASTTALFTPAILNLRHVRPNFSRSQHLHRVWVYPSARHPRSVLHVSTRTQPGLTRNWTAGEGDRANVLALGPTSPDSTARASSMTSSVSQNVVFVSRFRLHESVTRI